MDHLFGLIKAKNLIYFQLYTIYGQSLWSISTKRKLGKPKKLLTGSGYYNVLFGRRHFRVYLALFMAKKKEYVGTRLLAIKNNQNLYFAEGERAFV